MGKIPMFFNANGCFGKGARTNPYYYSAFELLAQMDRLGIAKSLVWSIAARDYSATWGNRKLIEEIDLVGAKDRLAPAFTISPFMLYEEGAMECLVKDMTENNVRALRIFPGTLMHNLRQIEPVINEVKKFKPVLFFDSRDSLNPEELLGLADAFPDIPMVHMQGMWGQLPAMLDIIRRRENILIDTSWLHTPHTIEMVVDRFGAGRMVFGTGFKSHNGASIAALLHADISDADREMIAHKNLELLLGLSDSYLQDGASGCRNVNNSSLWNKLINGRDIGIDIIDAHAHLGPYSALISEKGRIESQVEYLLPIMDRMNISTAIVSGTKALNSDAMEGNIHLEESLRSYKGRFLGYLGFNPLYGKELIPEFDNFFSRDFYIGFKLLCFKWAIPINDSRFDPVWEYADKHRLPILMHTWQGNCDSPVLLKDIVPKYPNAVFILGHSGGGDKGRLEAEELALANSNVYLEFCGSFTATIPYEDTIKKVGSDRVIFGTDVMFHNPVFELGRALSMDIPEEMLLPMMGANMRRIMALRT